MIPRANAAFPAGESSPGCFPPLRDFAPVKRPDVVSQVGDRGWHVGAVLSRRRQPADPRDGLPGARGFCASARISKPLVVA